MELWKESYLRNYSVNIMKKWLDAKRGSDTHKYILSVYNNHKPLARNHIVTVSEPWCATTISTVWIIVGIAEYIETKFKFGGTECSCNELIEIAKKIGWWVENDAYRPKIADCILYDWDSKTASGDNTGSTEHIGMISAINKNSFTVIEGNRVINNISKVATREIPYDWKYTRGFIAPNFAEVAKFLNNKNIKEDDDMSEMTQEKFESMYNAMMAKRKDNDASSYSEEARKWAIDNGIISGIGKMPNGDTNYAWDDIPTREQLITFLYRFFNKFIKGFKK